MCLLFVLGWIYDGWGLLERSYLLLWRNSIPLESEIGGVLYIYNILCRPVAYMRPYFYIIRRLVVLWVRTAHTFIHTVIWIDWYNSFLEDEVKSKWSLLTLEAISSTRVRESIELNSSCFGTSSFPPSLWQVEVTSLNLPVVGPGVETDTCTQVWDDCVVPDVDVEVVVERFVSSKT